MPRKKSSSRDKAPPAEEHSLARRPEWEIDDAMRNARVTTQRAIDEVVSYARRNPQQALLSALAAGYVLRMLPTTRMLGGAIRLALPLLTRAPLLYGMAKIVSARRAK